MECRTRFALRKAHPSRQACQVSQQSLTLKNWQPDGIEEACPLGSSSSCSTPA